MSGLGALIDANRAIRCVPNLAPAEDDEGQLVRTGESPLGSEFDAYLKLMDPEDLKELVHDTRFGVNVGRHLDPRCQELVASDEVRFGPPAVRNSKKIFEDADRVVTEVEKAVASGLHRVLGTVEELRAEGRMPRTHAATWEEKKPRFCWDGREVNKATQDLPTRLEGLGVVRENLQGYAGCQVLLDNATSYGNDGLDAESETSFCYVLFGFVLAIMALPFGWLLSCFLHQRLGMVLIGFLRRLGVPCESRLARLVGSRGSLLTDLLFPFRLSRWSAC